MTTPIDNYALPWAIFRPQTVGASDLQKVAHHGTGTSTARAYLPKGINTVMVTWAGAASLTIALRQGNIHYRTFSFPTGAQGTPRSMTMEIPAETDQHSISISTSNATQTDVDNSRAGVRIIPSA